MIPFSYTIQWIWIQVERCATMYILFFFFCFFFRDFVFVFRFRCTNFNNEMDLHWYTNSAYSFYVGIAARIKQIIQTMWTLFYFYFLTFCSNVRQFFFWFTSRWIGGTYLQSFRSISNHIYSLISLKSIFVFVARKLVTPNEHNQTHEFFFLFYFFTDSMLNEENPGISTF